jgi:hypothetical protein
MIEGVDPAIASMSPAEATAALAAMGTASNPAPPIAPPIAPATAQEERAQLNALARDSTFAAALFGGDRAARAQFDRLVQLKNDADVVGDALAGVDQPQPQIFETLAHGQIPARDVKAVIEDMRLAGISDGSIEEALRGTPVTAREYAAETALQASKHGDPLWVKNFLAGNYAEKREATLMSIVLSSPIAEPK